MSRNRNQRRTKNPGVYAYDTADGVRYLVSVDVAGPGQRRALRTKQGFRTVKDALAWKREQQERRSRGKPAGSRETVAQFAPRWIEHVATTVRPSTVYRYDQALRVHVLPALGETRLAAVHPLAVQELEQGLLAQGLAPASVRVVHAVLGRMLRQALAWGLIGEDPMRGVSPPAVGAQRGAVWTAEQARGFLEATKDEPWGELWAVLLGTGCRIGEALALQWGDIDLSTGTVTIRRGVVRDREGRWTVGEPKTARARRTIALGPVAMAALTRRSAARRELWVWPGCHGFAHPQAPQRAFGAACVRHGLPVIRLHDTRHVAISLALAEGVSLFAVSRRSGHSSIAITANRYGHLATEVDAEAAERLGRALGG